MNSRLKGILAATFALLVILLLLSRCQRCTGPEEDQIAYVPPVEQPDPVVIHDEEAPEPEPEPEPEPQPTPPPAPRPQPQPEPAPEVPDQGQDGEFRVTISWEFPGDVDLHVIEPSGNEIDYTNMRNGATGAELDVDNRQGGRPGSPAVENVYWTNPAHGTYVVDILFFSVSENAPNGGNVNIRIKNGDDVRTYRARLTRHLERITISRVNYQG